MAPNLDRERRRRYRLDTRQAPPGSTVVKRGRPSGSFGSEATRQERRGHPGQYIAGTDRRQFRTAARNDPGLAAVHDKCWIPLEENDDITVSREHCRRSGA